MSAASSSRSPVAPNHRARPTPRVSIRHAAGRETVPKAPSDVSSGSSQMGKVTPAAVDDVLSSPRALADLHTDDGQPSFGVAPRHGLERRQLVTAWRAPGRPRLQEHDAAAQPVEHVNPPPLSALSSRWGASASAARADAQSSAGVAVFAPGEGSASHAAMAGPISARPAAANAPGGGFIRPQSYPERRERLAATSGWWLRR